MTPWLGLYQAGGRLLSEATSDGKIKAALRARSQSASQKGGTGCQPEAKGQSRHREWSPEPGLRHCVQVGGAGEATRARAWALGSCPQLAPTPSQRCGGHREADALKSPNLLIWLEERTRPPTVCRYACLSLQTAGLGGCSQGLSAKSLSEFYPKYVRPG